MDSGIYYPNTVAKNNGGTVLGFGTATTTENSIANASKTPNQTNAVHSRSTAKSYSAGTANRFGTSAIYNGFNTTINGIANTRFRTTGNPNLAETHFYQTSRFRKITAIDVMAGTVTKHASWGTAYAYTTDNAAASAVTPYAVAPKLSYLTDRGGETTTYRKAGEV